MKVLVTGGASFIGSDSSEYLLKKNTVKVFAMSSMTSKGLLIEIR